MMKRLVLLLSIVLFHIMAFAQSQYDYMDDDDDDTAYYAFMVQLTNTDDGNK